MRLAVLQMEARAGDVEANLALIEEAAERAAAAGADLLLAPELAVTGYGAGESIRNLAEPTEGPQARRLGEISARLGIALAAGFAERDGATIWNAALLFDRGRLLQCYRKRQLWGDYEKALFSASDACGEPVEVRGIKAGLAICYDIEFPETARRLALAGAELILVPTALPHDGAAPFISEKILPVRAFENQVFVAYADHAGNDGRFNYAGRSCIVAPDGTDLARAGPDAAELLVAHVEPGDFAASRAKNP
jgi:predicted amidohydrolase